MAEQLLLLEQANIFLGDADPSASNHVKLQSVALPTLERVTTAHLGGGAVAEVNFSMSAFRALDPSFKFAGISEDSYRLLGIGDNEPQNFTIYGALRNKQTGAMSQAKAIVTGMIGRLAPDAFDRSSTFGHDHGITEVTHYELFVGGKEWFYLDYFTSRVREFGNDVTQSVRTILGIE
ncbi:phage major tail tube protein [Rhizobium sp. PAMB 3174]